MTPKKVLVVDFDPEFLKSASERLRGIGVEVLTAVDGQAGLETFRAERPDLVILEAMLPKIHGFDLCSRITADAARKAPVIIVSGVYRDAVYKTEALRTFGAAAYFEKPVDGDLLVQAVRKTLGLAEPVAAPAVLPAAKAAAPDKGQAPRKKEMAAEDIDNLLKDTLAEFGLRPEKKKAAPPAPEPAEVRPAEAPKAAFKPVPVPEPEKPRLAEAPKPAFKPAPAPVPEPAKPRPAAAPAFIPKPEPTAGVRPSPAPVLPPPSPTPKPVERTPEPPAAAPSFTEFAEPRAKKTPLYAALAGGVIVIAALGFLLLRGKKSPAEMGAPPSEPTALNTSLATPGEGQERLGGAAATDRLDASPVNPAAAPVKAKPSPRPAAEKPQPSAESLRPVASAAAPRLDLRVAGDAAAQPSAQTPARIPEPAAAEVKEAPKPEPDKTEAGGGAEPAASEPAPQLPAAKPEAAPAGKIQPGQLVPIESVDVAPRVVKEVRPTYPPMAMAMGIQGSVTINALVSETGDVLQTAYLRGVKDGGLDKAAEAAVRKMRFTPARKDGINVRVWRPVTITFRKG